MDYEKLHKDTINKLQQMVNSGKITVETACGICADFVPESEDEKIRKELIDYFKENNAALAFRGISNECVLDWLEKQGEHANFRNKIQIGDKVTRNEDGVLVNLSQLNRVAKKDEKQGETFTKKDVDDAYLKGICDAKHELEKQDGQNTVVVIPKFRVGDVIRPKGSTAEYTIESISGEYYHGKGWGLYISCDNDYELVEQKPTDKVEPKFKVKKGEWYVCTNTFVLKGKIIAIKGQTYQSKQEDDTITCEDYCLFIDRHDGKASNYFRLWTIQDANDGDVLATLDYILIFKKLLSKDGGVSYCHYDFGAGNPQFIWSEDKNWYFGKEAIVHPATKEQRDLLFQKMKEAGYEWDAEKKELKKIENEIEIPFGAKDSELQEATYYIPKGFHAEIEGNNVIIKKGEQKPAWSEEDEYQINTILHGLDLKRELYKKEGNKVEEDRYNTQYNWLKYLKDRYTWKPSDRELGAMLAAIGDERQKGSDVAKELQKIYQHLKKLREE